MLIHNFWGAKQYLNKHFCFVGMVIGSKDIFANFLSSTILRGILRNKHNQSLKNSYHCKCHCNSVLFNTIKEELHVHRGIWAIGRGFSTQNSLGFFSFFFFF
jgi:hypothetical protein